MKKLFIALIITTFISGCAAGPEPSAIPASYTGPISSVKDSSKQHSSNKADFFYLQKVDETTLKNNRSKTLADNYGQGFSMKITPVVRDVPSKQATFHIVGRTEYAAPILALSNPVYQVKGKVNFRPKPNVKYAVVGSLTPTYSAVWIEEVATKKVVGEKTVVDGSAELGFFQK